MFFQGINVNRFLSVFQLKAAPHSPRRQKLNLRMKSLSLDSPESTELHGRGRRYPPASTSVYYPGGGSGGHLEHSTPPSNNSRLHCENYLLLRICLKNTIKIIFNSSLESIKSEEAFICNTRNENGFS